MRLATVLILVATCVAHVAASEPVTAIAFGDSITFAHEVQPHERWGERVMAASNGAVKIVNEGKNGRRSDALGQFEQALARTPQATLVIIVLGTNDLIRAPADVADRLAVNLGKMVDAAAATLPAARVVLAAPCNINPATLSEHWLRNGLGEHTPKQLDAMRDALRALATKRQLGFVDLNGAVPLDHLPDVIHPDAAGQAGIAAAMLAVLNR